VTGEYTTLGLRCPVCNTEFTLEMPLVVPPLGRDTDLRPLFEGADPIPSFIHCCPSCRYTAYRDGFQGRSEELEEDFELVSKRPGDRPPVHFSLPDEAELEDLRRWIRSGELVRGLAEGREPFGAERYLLGGRCYEYLRDDDPVGASDYYLRAAWCARSAGGKELEGQCQREAMSRLQTALDRTLLSEGDRPRALYLIGELSRRSGDFAKAVDLFSQLESAAETNEDEESALFAWLARRQLALAIVKSDINAAIAEDDLEHELERPRGDDDGGPEEEGE
jgi:uncharacterized protein (DUF2225 family)